MGLIGFQTKVCLVKAHPTHDPQLSIIFWNVLRLSALRIQVVSTLSLPTLSYHL